ncbi:ATP-dependent DNA helicase (plasmid) [Paenibacillus polymyxa]|uniref:ATP-dependent DNA helicase n=1 Tax=Paenibacillus polymyxa TaxID=1406 RepID=UPI003B59D3A5
MQSFIDRAFQQGGHLSKLIPGYSPRAPQIQISSKVGQCLEEELHLLLEAGTGTGKSLGYLLPAARWAVQNNKKVVVCTHTIPLMNQIIKTELPRVQEIIHMENMNLRYMLIKGKSHYLCKTKLNILAREMMQTKTKEAEIIQKIVMKAERENIYDRTEFGFEIDDQLWNRISASMCPSKNKTGECSLERNRVGLSGAHIIVTNHAYFFNDLVLRKKTGNGNLPSYDAVIFDEAHEIEDVCCKAFEKKVDLQQFETLFSQFFNHDQVQRLGVDSRLKLNELHLSFQRKIENLYEGISQFLSRNHGEQAGFHLMYSKIAVEDICTALGDFIKAAKEMRIKSVSEILERLFEGNDNLDFIGQVEKRSWAYWATIDPYGKVVLHAAPLFPKVVLAYGLFDQVTVILASATIATGDNFNFFSGRIGLKDYASIIVGSPFDYKNKTMLICPADSPDPGSDKSTPYITEKLQEITMYSGGRMLVLFTSMEKMRKVYQDLSSFCKEQGYNLIAQQPGISREHIIGQLKADPNTIVLGCTSFWTGVDVPGNALTTVVIPNLPFPMPNDPLIQAQIKLIEEAGRSSFFDYMFPKMMTTLKQGFGRLNRSMTCQGAVIILDNRIVKKRYGNRIRNSLPSCPFSQRIEDLVHILPC